MSMASKLKTQPRWKAVFVRIDTAEGRPVFQTRACNELFMTFLLNFRQQGWFDLLGFVVLPKEIQLIIVPKAISIAALVTRLELETGALIAQIAEYATPIYDAELYFEPLDGTEAVKSRLQMMHAAPVRQRLANSAANYDFSSANPRYLGDLDLAER